jgi:hypothetical protein
LRTPVGPGGGRGFRLLFRHARPLQGESLRGYHPRLLLRLQLRRHGHLLPLSLDFQKDLRAVACYAPANWNICLPTNKHEPIAFFSTTGTNDPTCKWINSDARQQGGKYCVLSHLADNGLNVAPEIPLATSATHVTTEFKGTTEGYPVIFGSFVGGHTENSRDPGSNVNWISKETWDFFMRF